MAAEMEIKDVLGLKHHLRPCSQLTIQRKYGYNHHVFIGSVDQFGCDIYHYKLVLKPWWKLYSPAQVTKARLDYSSYSDDKEIKKIFNFENGDTVILVNRNDYPQNKDAEGKCIRRAESRVGAGNYSLAFNNCESYVNWVFSDDNTSWEYENAPLLKQMFANVIDVIVSSVVFKLYDLILRLWNSSRSPRQQRSQKQNNIGHTFKKEERGISKLNGSHLDLIVQKENNSQPELTYLERWPGQVEKSFMEISSIRHISEKEKDASIPYSVTCSKSSSSYTRELERSMHMAARGGTRFFDDGIFRNNKQNVRQCFLSVYSDFQPKLTYLERWPGQVDKSFMEISSIRHISEKEKDASIPYSVTCSKSSSSYTRELERSMHMAARGGTRFFDDDIFRNHKQNVRQCFLSVYSDLNSSVTMQDDTTEEIFETIDRSMLAVLSAGMELSIKSYRNKDDPFMTKAQINKRVFRDVFSGTGGVYGCVYGSHLATTMFPDSVNIAANIGCISGSLLGNAAGAIGSAALLH